MSLFFDIGTGTGLAGASGVRPFLPPLLAGALARGDAGIDFKHTPYEFLQSPAFLAGVFALAVAAYALERREPPAAERSQGAGGQSRAQTSRSRALDWALALLALALGALLCAGSVAQTHHASWWGLPAGVASAALGYLAVAVVVARARRRVERSAAALVTVYADLIALAAAGISVALPPVGFVALVAYAVLAVRGRTVGGRKYQGLRILR